MAYDYEGRGVDYEREDGSTFHVPKDDDVADAPLAFKDFAESIPFSEYVNINTINGGTRGTQVITEEDNGKMLFVTSDTTLDFSSITSEGFSVAAVGDTDVSVTFLGTNNDGTVGEYKVATVVRVNGINILSVAGEGSSTDCPECPQCPDFEVGGPGAPTILNPEGGSVIKFTAAPDGTAGPPIAHGAFISPEDGATVTVDQDNLEVAVSGTTPDTDYVVSVYGVNEAGRGEAAETDAFQLNYNVATGGTETIVDNYNGTTEKWMVHKFTTDAEFSITKVANPFSVLVVGGGAGGSGYNPSCDGGPGCERGGATGGGGNNYVENSQELSGTLSVVVGQGGGAGANGSCNAGGNPYCPTVNGKAGGNGGPSKLGTFEAAGGIGVPQFGTATQHYVTSNITGTNVEYGRNHGGQSAPGSPGIVIVAYQIGMSTTREIEQAQAVREAHDEGFATGSEFGAMSARDEMENKMWTMVEEIAQAAALQTAVEETVAEPQTQTSTSRKRRK